MSIFSLKKFDPPYSLYKHISQDIVDKSSKHGYHYELIIAHKSLAEYITFSSGMDALPWEPEYEIAPDKLWRVATGLNSKSISYFSGIKFKEQSVHFLSPNYFLIREDHWQVMLKNIQQEDEDLYTELLTWKNPHEIRPGYLLKEKRLN